MAGRWYQGRHVAGNVFVLLTMVGSWFYIGYLRDHQVVVHVTMEKCPPCTKGSSIEEYSRRDLQSMSPRVYYNSRRARTAIKIRS